MKKIINLLKIIKIGITLWEDAEENTNLYLNDNNNNYNRYIPPHFRWYLMMRLSRALLPLLQHCGIMDFNPTQVLIEEHSLNQVIFWSIFLVTAVIMDYLSKQDKDKDKDKEEYEDE